MTVARASMGWRGATTAAITSRSSALPRTQCYLTDLWQDLIDTGIRLDPVFIAGCWREIDTGQDLDRARQLLESSKEWS